MLWITNMGTMGNFELVSNKFEVVGMYSSGYYALERIINLYKY
jgi:hypothetical protein